MNEQEKKSLKNFNGRLDVWLPFIILAFAGMCIFLTESRGGGFVPGGMYSGVSVHGMTLSKNLMNSGHTLFMYMSKEIDNGRTVYTAYNRFPVFSFLLIGLATHPFDQNFELQVYIARQLMNIFFFLSIIIVFRLVKEMTNQKYLALSAALLTFSSFYLLSYSNMIFNDIPALLGFVLVFYVIVKSEKDRLKIPQILFYSLVPVCLGWQPFAAYLTWLAVDAVVILFEKRTDFRQKIFNILRKPSFIITAIAISWGILILGLQLLNEWRITGGLFLHLSSVNSGLWRSGLISAEGHTQFLWTFNWPGYLLGQARAMTVMLLPFWPIFQIEPGLNASAFIAVTVIIYTIIQYTKDKSPINKIHVILVLSGLLWTIPMKHFAALHEFQSIFYIGFAVSIYIRLLSRINTKLFKLLAVDIIAAFVINTAIANHLKVPDAEMNKVASQFQNIREHLPENSKVYFDGDRGRAVPNDRYAVDFLLSGNWFTQLENADYVISVNTNYNSHRLTNNPGFNLFKISR